MKSQKIIMLAAALVLMAGTAGALTWLRASQKLGKPGIVATPIPGSIVMKIALPAQVLDFTSTNVPEPAVALGYFPKDTSYAERIYRAPDGQRIQSTIVMMGSDRTSIHRPEYCMPGQGWTINEKETVNLPMGGERPYQIQAAKWKVSNTFQQPDGTQAKVAGVYVFWFAADNEETMDHDKMLEWLTMDLLRTGRLQRWAYISYFTACEPGREDAAYEQMKKLIVAAAPQFEFPPERK